MRQILYISENAFPGDGADLVGILQQSRHNNALDGVSGLLWSDGAHFIQVIEGPAESVGATFARIEVDPRHRGLRVLQDRSIEAREFSGWTMQHRRASEPADIYDAQVRRLLANASPPIKQGFLDLIASTPTRP